MPQDVFWSFFCSGFRRSVGVHIVLFGKSVHSSERLFILENKLIGYADDSL